MKIITVCKRLTKLLTALSVAAIISIIYPLEAICANAIQVENANPGNLPSEWDIDGIGDSTIQGFTTDISVNAGATVHFKIDTDASNYQLNIYRMGYYGGDGARKVATVNPSAALPQVQPSCLTDAATGLIDCGNWTESASWAVPSNATSGIYFAKAIRTDTGGASHIFFIVRNDASHSDILFQASDTTWQAYNDYGGNSLYLGNGSVGRAYKVSFNRPFQTRLFEPESWVFNAEYPMVRWLESNGYDVAYFTDTDSDRNGALILNHKVWMSNGHDEYWSGNQRANVEAARNAGTHLAFFSSNTMFWKTRWENSIDSSATPTRTLVCYKETHDNAKTDPAGPNMWTGTWRDPRFSPPADGGRPENALLGTIFMINGPYTDAITVPQSDGKMRFWRGTSVASLSSGATATLAPGTLGAEVDVDLDNGFRPAGLFGISTNVIDTDSLYLLDYGSNYGPGSGTHKLTLYRHTSGALVFSSGTYQWSWGLDVNHDRSNLGSTADVRMKQATVNLLADMGVQPTTLQSGLVVATQSADITAPTSVISSPLTGATLNPGSPTTINGTASDNGGGVVGGVEVSTDNGVTWHPAVGRGNWSYSWTPTVAGPTTIQSRAVDDSGNMETPSAGQTITVNGVIACTSNCSSLWNTGSVPATIDSADTSPYELGVKFKTDSSGGYITGIRFYKADTNTGTHIGNLWDINGQLLATATFVNETSSGWQQVSFLNPVALTADTVYVASYHTNAGHYSYDSSFFSTQINSPPLHALADSDAASPGNGVYAQSSSSAFPTHAINQTNYWVDVVYSPTQPPAATLSSISVTPNGQKLQIGSSRQFTALGYYSNGSTQDITNVVDWLSSVTGVATIGSTTGLATAVGPGNTTITASKSGTGITGSANLIIQANPLTITTTSLHNGTIDVPYSVTLTASGGNVPYTWSKTGSLPAGLSLDQGTGTISGTPTATGTFSFTVQVTDVGNPVQIVSVSLSITIGQKSPILIITSSLNPFSSYYAEILRAEGVSEFNEVDISYVTSGMLASFDVVILGEMSLTSGQVTTLSNWVNAGGHLIAMHPDKQLASLLGLTDHASTMANTYLLVNTATGPGVGIVNQTIQYHGTADLYTLNGASSLATLYSDATTATSYPAVTMRTFGSGQAAAFTYDLARSVVYTRQGNPAWAGQLRDGDPSGIIRSDDLFYGAMAGDVQPDWVDLNKVAIPQADEQQRLLANLIIQLNFDKKPLPRFWYFPRSVEAVVVMTGDAHGGNGIAGRFDDYVTLSTPGCNINNWECIRATTYLYTDSTPTFSNADAVNYNALSFEVGLHVNTSGNNWTPSELENYFATQLSDWSAKYTSLPSPVSNRVHAVTWSDYSTMPVVELNHGIRFDTNYYYYPPAWITDRPGMFTGSGIPMRFADSGGNLIDVYQAPTQMTDESGQTYPFTIDALLNKATGPEGYYGAFVANLHMDNVVSTESNQVVAAAKALGIPVVTARQMLTWLDGRNASSFSSLAGSRNTVSFSISVDAGANGLVAMVPVPVGKTVTSMTFDANPFSSYDMVTIKGVQYARFTAANGNYTVVLTKDNQATLTVTGLPASATYGQAGIVAGASGGSGSGVVTFSATGSACTVNASTGAVAIISGSGTCSITATKAADANYNSATSNPASIATITRAGQTIVGTGFNPTSVAVNGTTVVSATGGSSTQPVIFSSQTGTVCSVSGTNGSTVTGVTVGNCIIAANQAGDANYNAATQVTQTISVGKGSQTIVGTGFNPTSVAVNGTTVVSATGGGSTQPVIFTSQTGTVCSVSGTNGSTVTVLTVGNCIIAANQAGDANYNAATQITQTISVGKAAQTIVGTGFNPTSVAVNGTTVVSATGGGSTQPVIFSSQTGTVCSVSGTHGSIVTGVTAGNCIIAANQAGDANYNAATQITQTISVGKAGQTIIGTGFNPTSVAVNGTTVVSATGGSSTQSVIFTSQTGTVCSVSGANGSIVTGVTVGNCIIAANQAGDANYNAATQITQTISVGKGSQTIIATGFNPTNVVVNGTTVVSATGGSSTQPVIFSSQTGTVCSVTNGSTVTGVTAGNCIIAANQAGDANYNAATQITQTISVGKAGQTIIGTGFNPTSVAVNGTTVVSATGGSSTQPVIFSSQTGTVCSVTNGSTVTGVTAGNCIIAANQAGDANYNAATQITQTISVGKGSQTIIATGFNPTSVVVNGTTIVSAAGGGSTQPVIFSSQTGTVCSVSGTNGSTVTGVTVGNCIIAANQAGDANYNAATQMTQTISVGKGSQTIIATGFNPTSVVVNGTTIVSAAGGGSTQPVIFSSQTGTVCSATGANGSTITGLTAGTCTIAANQAGDANYNAATQITQTISVGKGSQTIIATGFNPTSVAVNETTVVSATGGGSTQPVIFSSQTGTVCSVTNGSTVTALKAGNCIIAANQAGDANYNAATQITQTISVGKGGQAIIGTGFNPISVAVNGTTIVSAAGGGSTQPVIFSSQTGTVCSVSGTNGSTVTALTAGTCTIAANQAGDANYNAAAPVMQTISVGKAGQTIVGTGFNPTSVAVNGTTIVSATGGSSTQPVIFSSQTGTVCSVSGTNGSTVTGLTAGNCIIAANQAGDANYNAATQITQTISVGKAAQTIIGTGFNPTSVAVNGTTIVSATGGSSTQPVIFSSQTGTVCSVSGTNGSTVTGLTAGNCIIAANQAGDANYNAATQITQTISVGKAAQTIIGTGFNPTSVAVNGTTVVSATGGASGNPVTFTSTTPSVCSVSGTNGSTVTALTAGNCIIAANQVGNANYNAATQVTQTISAGKGGQTIVGTGFNPTSVAVNGTTIVSATGGGSTQPVIFSSQTGTVCSVSGTNGSTVTALTAGNCIIAANQAGDANYNAAAPVMQTISVGKAGQTIVGTGFNPTSVAVNGTTVVSATGGSSTQPVTFTSTTPSVCSVSGTNGSTVTGVTAGNCIIAANQAGDANYNAATQITQTISVGKGSQTIIGTGFNPTSVVVNGTTIVSATGGGSTQPVIFSSQTGTVCSVTNGSTVTALTAGNCIIAANQAGDANYNAATQVTQTISVGKAAQIINGNGFNPTSVAVNETTVVSATGGASGNPVTFTSTTPSVCSVSGANGSTVTALTAGNCIIAANQAGNANYNAATQVTQTISAGKGGQTIVGTGFNPTSVAVNGTTIVSATGGGSTQPVIFSSQTGTVCTATGANGSTITGLTAGTCTIAANQAGDVNFNAAAPVMQTISVGKAGQTIVGTGFNPTSVVVNGTTVVSATGGSSTQPVTFTSTTPSVCSVSGTNGSTVTGLTAGNCIIAANQAADANYNAATQVTQTISVGKAGQTIVGTGFNPTSVVVNGTTVVSATGGSSTQPVTFTSTTPSVCSVSGTNGSTVTGLTAGNCIIAANQAGDANYNAATQVTQTIGVGKGGQTITFTNPGAQTFGTTPTLTATVTSGLTPRFTSSTTGVCTITAGGGLTFVATGSCTINADQVGNANYNAASQVAQTFTVNKANQAITVNQSVTKNFGDAPFDLNTYVISKGSSTNPIIFAVTSGPGTIDMVTTKLTIVDVGAIVIRASQAGNANYNQAADVTINITVPPTGSFTPGVSTPVITDALKALRIAAGLDIPTAWDIAHGDVAPVVNGVRTPDGKIDLNDVVAILRKAMGLSSWL